MRIAVIGASSGTGREVVAQALGRGHKVVAVSHHGCDVPGVVDVTGSATDPWVLGVALNGCDAVVITVGGDSDDDRNRTNVTGAVLDALENRDVRLVVQSALGVGDSAQLLGAPERLFARTVLRGALADHADQEDLVRRSGRRYTIVRPGGLVDGPASGHVSTGGPDFVSRITRADVAGFILDALENDSTIGGEFNLGS